MVEVNTIKSVYPGWNVTPTRDKKNNKKKDQQSSGKSTSQSKISNNGNVIDKTGDSGSHIDDYV